MKMIELALFLSGAIVGLWVSAIIMGMREKRIIESRRLWFNRYQEVQRKLWEQVK